MIQYVDNRSIFDSEADALVNPVNTKGTMGKGLALEFEKRFPECTNPYKSACSEGKLVTGTLLVVQLVVKPNLWSRKRPAIILFPTKEHWRGKSRIEWIETGLQDLKNKYHEWNLNSVAIPRVGCGLGGLKWDQVKPLIEKYFADEPFIVEVYLNKNPSESPYE
jgi:O-acetyl-ADP-ribose deacetylase (regulator of RNase III)